ncbi:hypothetical protein FOZ60_003021 [Perkinsus olseni]|uniref:Uncharacterized protein n=1 Tax=Perkinsus olseni TaxID=32597 RepID=A0A7J6PIR0_PEROL|nr:hypothetical protein FOZ60_003021 [Perkinsus olseni]
MMAYLQQQSDRDQEALNKLIRSTLPFDEMSKTVAGCGLSSSESDAATCASSSSGAELPATTGLPRPTSLSGQFWEKMWGEAYGPDSASVRHVSYPEVHQSGRTIWPAEQGIDNVMRSDINRDSVALEREAVKAETKCEVVKETTAELGGLETYLAQQREHLATAIFKDWVTPNASHERQTRLKSACQELVRRSFREVVCARATEPSKYTTRRMQRSADGPVE